VEAVVVELDAEVELDAVEIEPLGVRMLRRKAPTLV
jgi:hypothetical protein